MGNWKRENSSIESRKRFLFLNYSKEYLYLASNMGKCTLYFSIKAALFNVIIHLYFKETRKVFIEN